MSPYYKLLLAFVGFWISGVVCIAGYFDAVGVERLEPIVALVGTVVGLGGFFSIWNRALATGRNVSSIVDGVPRWAVATFLFAVLLVAIDLAGLFLPIRTSNFSAFVVAYSIGVIAYARQ